MNGATFSRDVQVVAYPHIQTHRLYWPATATAQVVDLKVAPLRVGYIMGSGDQVPDALRRMGIDVTLIDDETLATGDLSRFDTIVVGIRASEARPEFVANNGRLIQYMERGGTLIVQYQQGDYVMRGLPPYPASAAGNVSRHRRNGACEDPRARASGVHLPEPDHGRTTSTAGCRSATCTRGPTSILATRRCSRPPIPANRRERGGEVYARGRQGPLRLHVVCMVPAAARRRARRVSSVRQPGQPLKGTATMRRLVLLALAVTVASTVTDAQNDLLARARALHTQVPLIDGHNDYPWALREHNVERDINKLDIRMPQPKIHTDIPRLRAGGVGGQFWSVYVPATMQGQTAVRATLEQVDVVHRMMRKYPDTFELALTAADVERIFKTGRIASLIGMEGGHSIDNSLATLRMFHGARRALHDADAQHEHSMGGLGHRHAEAGRPVEVRRGGRARDEPARHARRPEPHLARHDGGRDPRVGGAGHLLAFGCARRARPRTQRAGQRAARCCRRTAAS